MTTVTKAGSAAERVTTETTPEEQALLEQAAVLLKMHDIGEWRIVSPGVTYRRRDAKPFQLKFGGHRKEWYVRESARGGYYGGYRRRSKFVYKKVISYASAEGLLDGVKRLIEKQRDQ